MTEEEKMEIRAQMEKHRHTIEKLAR